MHTKSSTSLFEDLRAETKLVKKKEKILEQSNRFDELAKAANVAVSRQKALKLVGAALLGSVIVLLPLE